MIENPYCFYLLFIRIVIKKIGPIRPIKKLLILNFILAKENQLSSQKIYYIIET